MLLILLTLILLVIGIGLLIIDDRCDILFCCVFGILVLSVGIAMGLTIGTITIINHISVDKKIYEAEMQYESITKQLKVVDSEYEDFSRTYIIQKVYDWNAEVHSQKYWSNNPWTDKLFSKRYADSLKYIEMEE